MYGSCYEQCPKLLEHVGEPDPNLRRPGQNPFFHSSSRLLHRTSIQQRIDHHFSDQRYFIRIRSFYQTYARLNIKQVHRRFRPLMFWGIYLSARFNLLQAESLPRMTNTLSSSGPVILPVSAARTGINKSLPLTPDFSLACLIAAI